FEGSEYENPMGWIQDFESLAEMPTIPKDDLLKYLCFYLIGRARRWRRTIDSNLHSWGLFRTLFDARYKSEEILDAWEKELESKKQDRDVNDLALSMEGMFQRL
ncbi:hypothetical protein BGW37DRAFT_399936, partial [Umbelopsis sp. PMI_123]